MAEIPNPFEVQEPVKSLQDQHRYFNRIMKDKPFATAHYLMVTGGEADERTNAANVMKMGHYVNPELTFQSDYFKSLDQMMTCVEKNSGVSDAVEQGKVCVKEFRNLRLAAFNSKLLYSEVNRRWFMTELEHKRNYSGF